MLSALEEVTLTAVWKLDYSVVYTHHFSLLLLGSTIIKN